MTLSTLPRKLLLLLAWSAVPLAALAVAGIWLFSTRAVVVLSGGAIVGAVIMRTLYAERRTDERVRVAMLEAHEREQALINSQQESHEQVQALIRTIGRLTGSSTGPIPAVREVA